MEVIAAFKPSSPYWRGALLIALLGAVSFGVYHFFFSCPHVQATAPPDHLVVKRTIVASGGLLPQAPGAWTFDASQAQEVLAAIDNLPASTTDTRYCPLSDGTAFSYTFLHRKIIVLQASAQEGGCHVLNLSGCDIRQEGGNFLLLMERLLNLSSI